MTQTAQYNYSEIEHVLSSQQVQITNISSQTMSTAQIKEGTYLSGVLLIGSVVNFMIDSRPAINTHVGVFLLRDLRCHRYYSI